jgi:hypothetical protein
MRFSSFSGLLLLAWVIYALAFATHAELEPFGLGPRSVPVIMGSPRGGSILMSVIRILAKTRMMLPGSQWRRESRMVLQL